MATAAKALADSQLPARADEKPPLRTPAEGFSEGPALLCVGWRADHGGQDPVQVRS